MRETENIKILHCISQLPGMTGSGIYYRHLVKGLDNLGFKNALLFAEQSGCEVALPPAEKYYPIQFKNEELPFAIPGMSDEMPYESTIYSQMSPGEFAAWRQAFKKRLKEAKEEFQPDVIVSHHVFMMTSIVREVFDGIPVIGISHGTDIRQVRMNPWIHEKYVTSADELDAYFALSPTDAERLHKIFSISMDKITVTGGGFDETIFHPDLEESSNEAFNLIYAGKVSHAKGVYELARAFPKILEQIPQSRLLIVGNATEEQKKRIIQKAGESNHLEFTPAVRQEDYAKFLQKAHVYILPSYYEGIALSAIEALATRTRVVISENENLSWLLGDIVNDSGVIDYIKLPRLENVDTPVGEDIPGFVQRIADAVVAHYHKIEADPNGKQRSAWSLQVTNEVADHSWSGIIDEIALMIKKLI